MIRPENPASSADVASHYDDLDWFYRDAWGGQLHHGIWEDGTESTDEAVEKLRDLVADGASASAGARVCDIGCGYGTAALHWARIRGWKMVGFTVSERQREVARESAGALEDGIPRPEFLCRDWLHNELGDSSCEAAVSIECLSHVADKEPFFSEIERVLQPGGHLSLSAWICGKKVSPLVRRFLLKPICEGGRFPGLLSAEELRSLALNAGLEVERLERIGPRVKKTWRVILGRIFGRLTTRAEYRRFLWEDLRSGFPRALTVVRVWVAFELGLLDYALLVARKVKR